ncbi:MAG: hypothetical protein R3B72_28365 [Polyangiaceae bacterium]
MKDPIRLSDEGGLSALERELLDAGRTPGRTAAQRKRHAARIAAVAAPVGLGAWLTGPGTAWAWLKAAGGGWLHGGFWIYAGTVLASAAVTLGLALAVTPSEPDVSEPEVSEPEVSEPGGPDAHEAHPSEGRSDEGRPSPVGPGVAAPAEPSGGAPTYGTTSSEDASTAGPAAEGAEDATSDEAVRGVATKPRASATDEPGRSGDRERIDDGGASETEPAAPSSDGSLAAEAKLLTEARGTLATDPRGALALLDAHAQRFPAGRLAPERELVRLEVLIQLGRRDEARAHAEALLHSSRSQLYADRLRAILARLR